MKNKIKNFFLKFNNTHKSKTLNDKNEILEYNIIELLKKNPSVNLNPKELLKLFDELLGTSNVEGLKILESILLTEKLDGDVCEFGVAQGKTSKLISKFILNSNKKLYLFDSFEGLPKPSQKDKLKDDIFNLGKIENYEGLMSHKSYKVINELKKINFPQDRLIINKGYFNMENLKNFIFPNYISFAYIDFDFYDGIKDALISIENKLLNGSIIIIDDYDHFSTGVKAATDEWILGKSSNYEIKKIKTSQSSFAIVNKKK